jgi:hypothetical protein
MVVGFNVLVDLSAAASSGSVPTIVQIGSSGFAKVTAPGELAFATKPEILRFP